MSSSFPAFLRVGIKAVIILGHAEWNASPGTGPHVVTPWRCGTFRRINFVHHKNVRRALLDQPKSPIYPSILFPTSGQLKVSRQIRNYPPRVAFHAQSLPPLKTRAPRLFLSRYILKLLLSFKYGDHPAQVSPSIRSWAHLPLPYHKEAQMNTLHFPDSRVLFKTWTRSKSHPIPVSCSTSIGPEAYK